MRTFHSLNHVQFLSFGLIFIFTFCIIARIAHAQDDLNFDLEEEYFEQEHAPSYTLCGSVENRTQFGVNQAEFYSFRQRLHLEFSTPPQRYSFFADGDLDYDPAVQNWTDQDYEQFHAQLGKCYFSLDTDFFDLTAGQNIVRWGTGDGINPFDLFNPVDSRDPIANARSLARLPVPMLHAVVQASPCTFEAVFLPQAQVNSPFLSGSPWEGTYLQTLREHAQAGSLLLDDENEPEGVEYGLRSAVTFDGWDLSLIFIRGYTNSPVFKKDTQAGIPSYTAKHPQFTAYGLNFAKGFSRGTLRGELALKPDSTFAASSQADDDGLVKTDYFQGVIGIDWTFFTDLYLNAQYFMESFPHGRNGAASRPYVDGMTFKIKDLFLDNALELGLQGMLYFSGDGLSLEPYAQYEINDHWKITAGFLLWEGERQGRLGQYDDNDMAYLKIKYAF